MIIFLTGLVIFLGVHSISIVNESWRDYMADKMGVWPWKGVYSLISVLGFILFVQGYGIVRYESAILYTPPVWLKHVALLLMLPVFPLLVAAYLPGRIKAVTRHPMLLATMLWASAHLLVNGSLVDTILFGSILAWAVWDRLSLQKRVGRPVPGAPVSRFNDVIACVAGLGLYFAFIFWLHLLFIGVPLT